MRFIHREPMHSIGSVAVRCKLVAEKVVSVMEDLAKEMLEAGLTPDSGWSIAESRWDNFDTGRYVVSFWAYRSRDEQRLDIARKIAVPMHG